MKHLTSLLMTLALALVTLQASAQAPQGFSFQAIVRDNLGDPLMSTAVGMRLSVLQGSASGTAVYVETHAPTTNANGLASVQVGGGTPVTGTFAGINWGAGPYFLKSETDPNGGTSYTISGTQQLMSVPYALYAANAGSGSSSWTVTGNDQASAVTGNVGIGTTAAPATKLEVNGNVSIDGNSTLRFGQGLSGQEAQAGKIGYATFTPGTLEMVGAGTNATNRKIKFYNEGGATFTGGADIEGGSIIGAGYQSTPAPSNGLLVQGNVGIGTLNAPTTKLEVNGSISIDGNAPLELGRGVADKETNAGRIGYQMFSDALDIVGAGSTGSNRKIKFYGEGGATFTGGANFAGAANMNGGATVGSGYAQSTPPTNGMTVQGNVEIGSTAPTAKLQLASADPGTDLLRAGLASDFLSQESGDSYVYTASVDGIRQSFIPLVAVTLNKVAVYLDNGTGSDYNFTLEILQDFSPLSSQSATAAVGAGWREYTLPAPLALSAGTGYAIRVIGGTQLLTWRYAEGNPYPDGEASFGGGQHDMTFRLTGAGSEQVSILYDGRLKLTGGGPGAGKVLTSDANGVATWQNAANGADNMGNHIASSTVQLNNNWLSNDGGAEGIRVDNNGNVGIGVAPLLAESKLVIGAQDAVDEGGEIQLNAGGSWGTKAYFMDVYQNGLRIMDGTTAGSANVRMQISNAGVVSVNNGLQVGAAGTTFAKMQGGTATLGAGAAGVNSFTVTFPTAFASTPKVTCTVRNGSGAGATEMFAVTTKQISATQFSVNVVRLDVSSAGWGQALQLDWMAFE